MCFFENDYFLNILKTYKDKTFPMLVPVINDLAENHWHKILQESLIALKTILKEIDPYAFEEAIKMDSSARKKWRVKQDLDERRAFDDKWITINNHLKQKETPGSKYQPPVLPFSSDKLIRDYNILYLKIYDKVKAVEMWEPNIPLSACQQSLAWRNTRSLLRDFSQVGWALKINPIKQRWTKKELQWVN